MIRIITILWLKLWFTATSWNFKTEPNLWTRKKFALQHSLFRCYTNFFKIIVYHIPPWLNISVWILLHLLNVKHWKYLFLKFSPAVWNSSINEYLRRKQKKQETVTGLTALLTSVLKELDDSWKDTAGLGHTWSLTKIRKSPFVSSLENTSLSWCKPNPDLEGKWKCGM